MIKTFIPLFLTAIVVISGCRNTGQKTQLISQEQPDSTYIPSYAKGFVINYYKDYHQIVLKDPWGDSNKITNIALLIDSVGIDVARKHNDFVTSYPATKWIALSSTMVNYAGVLDMKHTICGVAEPEYISDTYIKKKVDKGLIRDVGIAAAPDVEVIVDMEPDFMMVSPFKDNHFASIKGAGIPVIANADYLEHTPLGRAEWLVFVGELLGEGEKAKQLFSEIESEYKSVKTIAQKTIVKPTVFTGHLYQGIWNTPAGESFMANFFNDAGCDYIYKDTKGTGSLNLDYETIIDRAEKTDFWVLLVNYPGDFGYNSLMDMDRRYADFNAFKNRKVIATNASNSLYFEKGLLEPHIVLSDLAYAFHPEILPDYQPVYFHLLKAE